jgi:hypothetical protein
MREECKHFQSRTYASGEVARFCILDLAPEAPWRCPADCKSFVPRLADAGWVHGSLVEPPVEDEPAISAVTGEEMASILQDAESIVSAVAPQALAEARAEDARREQRAAGRWWRRKR